MLLLVVLLLVVLVLLVLLVVLLLQVGLRVVGGLHSVLHAVGRLGEQGPSIHGTAIKYKESY